MTTLPQTTHVRLPRPMAGGMQLAAQGGLAASGGGGTGSQQGANEVWRVIRSHLWMILIVTCVIAPIAGVGVNYFLARNYPRYTAAGFIQVQPQVMAKDVISANTPTSDPANTALEIRTHAQLLRTESLLTKVLQNVNSEVRKTRWFAQFGGDIRKAKADFEDNLSVTPVQDTKLVKVEFTYAEPVDCKTIVYELVSTYLEDQKKFTIDSLLDRTSMLNNVRIKTEARLKDLRNEMHEKQIKLNTDGGGIGRAGVKEMELSKLISEQIDAQMKANKARAEYDATSSAIQQGQDPGGVDMAVQHMFPYLMSEEWSLGDMQAEVEAAKEQYGDENPKYKSFLRRYEIKQAAYQKKSEE
ncbi:MAG TPA: hypothetical protein VH475_12755, partial [Tepidisphaeraceae bacterium]